jgi:diguanylate cyclase (GGDEF)-like protein
MQYGTLFKEWVASNRQLEMLNALARRINESLDLDEVLAQVGALTLELTKAERAFVVLAEPEGQGFRVAVDQHGKPAPDARLSWTVCRDVHASGEPVALLDASLSEAYRGQASIADLDLRTLMCVPLTARGQALGVLYVDSRAVVATFTRKDLELLQAIAGHASGAIANASLYAQSRRQADELARALEMYREAARQANTDALTGLNNRRCFEEIGARELDLARRYGRHLTVILLDVDHFKSFNDTYGHAVGDQVLVAVAGALAECVRVCDVPARLGGEEFAVLCPETTPEGALAVAERIRLAVMAIDMGDAEGGPVRDLTASLGVAAFEPADRGIAAVLERADRALYNAKNSGRNRSQIWLSAAEPVSGGVES